MLFLLVFLSSTLYLYATRNLKSLSFFKQFIVWIPTFLAFYIPMAFQKDVGTDYYSYISIYSNAVERYLYAEKGEYLFLWIIDFAKIFNHYQFVFIIFSLIISLSFFYSLFVLKNKYDYKAWLIFFIYFSATGIYNTSFNTLRQSIIISLLPFLIHLFVKKRHLIFLLCILALSFLHKSVLLYLSFYLVALIPNNKKIVFFAFVFSTLLYTINFGSIINILANNPLIGLIFGNYSYYVDSSFFDAGPTLSIVTKLYYLPLFMLFWLIYVKEKNINLYFDFTIKLWAVTCFMIIQMMHIGIFYRFWNMFAFLYVFPIYYVVDYYIKKRDALFVFLLILYIIIPYIIKVLILPSAEYLYNFNNLIF
ncbi:EpsG family protein [Acinetobacter baumannii]|uniref:EpsG family protein n=1 Tax=Acinetobacter baumannii TaxID=470 RepID=UPI00295989FB|nr:EpsG family protein [Acinetobacter baumannii]HEE5342666.1 EpsG family protein [Acinetobacter baumannii]